MAPDASTMSTTRNPATTGSKEVNTASGFLVAMALIAGASMVGVPSLGCGEQTAVVGAVVAGCVALAGTVVDRDSVSKLS